MIHHLSHFYHPSGVSGASYAQEKAHLDQNLPFMGHFHTIGCICLTSFASRVVPSHVFHCDPQFVQLLPAMGGLRGHLWPKMMVLVQNWPFLGPFHAIRCTFLTSFSSRVVPPHDFHCDPLFVPLLPAMGGLRGHSWPKMAVLAQNWPFLGPFLPLGALLKQVLHLE